MTPQEPLWGALEALEGGSWGLIGNQGAPLGPPITPRRDTRGVIGVTCGVIGLPWGAILGAPSSIYRRTPDQPPRAAAMLAIWAHTAHTETQGYHGIRGTSTVT